MTIKDKEVTQLAMKKRREAHMVRLNGMSKYSGFIDERVAKSIEAEAETMLAVDELPITALGEVSHPHISGLWEQGKGLATDTLKMAGIVPEEASIKRTDLLLQESLDIASMALDASNSIKADNSLEKMLAHQMVAAHELMMKSANSAMNELEKLNKKQISHQYHQEEGVEYQRLANSTAKLMNAFSTHYLTLQKIRSGGNQTMTVQHVHVNEGGQAVIGSIHRGRGEKNE